VKVVYSSSNRGGRELRVEAETTPEAWAVKIVCDAPGERAVSHDLTPADLDSLIATLSSLQPEAKPEIVLPTTVEEPS
jgi:hypothetical protein